MKKFFFLALPVFVSVFISCSSISKAETAELMKIGSEGQDVYEVQTKLKRMGYFPVQPTGYFGSISQRAVIHFQQDTGLLTDGIIGPKTRYQLVNVEMMARVVHGEARGESYTGKVAVAAVILNRKDSIHFPNTVAQVIFQPNAFTPVNDGQYHLTPDNDAYRAVIDALKGWDPTYGST